MSAISATTKECRECGQEKPAFFTGFTSDGRKRFIGDSGSMWSRNQCPDCRKAYLTANDRRRGIRAREDCDSPSIQKGLESELIAAEFLKSLGYTIISVSKMHGPDLIIEIPKTKEIRTVEVKTTVNAGRSWTVNRVNPPRRNDDYFLAVHNKAVLFMEAMTDHLKQCGKNGARVITKLIRGEYV